MAKTAVSQWDTTANNNTDVGGISLAENVMQPPAVNDAFREMMAQIASGVVVKTAATTTVSAYFQLAEATNNGINKLTLTPTTSLTADRTATFPDASGTVYLVDQAFIAPAGTTSITPVKFQSGTLNTTAAAGAIEYDGKAIYATAVASSRQIVPAMQFVAPASVVGLTNNITTLQNLFPAASDVLTVAAATTYFFEMDVVLTTGATSHSNAIAFGGTATFTACNYNSIVSHTAGVGSFNTNGNFGIVGSASQTTLDTASTQIATLIKLSGVLRVNGAGTIIPQLAFSAGPTGTCQVELGSYFRIWPVGDNTVVAVGNWA